MNIEIVLLFKLDLEKPYKPKIEILNETQLGNGSADVLAWRSHVVRVVS